MLSQREDNFRGAKYCRKFSPAPYGQERAVAPDVMQENRRRWSCFIFCCITTTGINRLWKLVDRYRSGTAMRSTMQICTTIRRRAGASSPRAACWRTAAANRAGDIGMSARLARRKVYCFNAVTSATTASVPDGHRRGQPTSDLPIDEQGRIGPHAHAPHLLSCLPSRKRQFWRTAAPTTTGVWLALLAAAPPVAGVVGRR